MLILRYILCIFFVQICTFEIIQIEMDFALFWWDEKSTNPPQIFVWGKIHGFTASSFHTSLGCPLCTSSTLQVAATQQVETHQCQPLVRWPTCQSYRSISQTKYGFQFDSLTTHCVVCLTTHFVGYLTTNGIRLLKFLGRKGHLRSSGSCVECVEKHLKKSKVSMY